MAGSGKFCLLSGGVYMFFLFSIVFLIAGISILSENNSPDAGALLIAASAFAIFLSFRIESLKSQLEDERKGAARRDRTASKVSPKLKLSQPKPKQPKIIEVPNSNSASVLVELIAVKPEVEKLTVITQANVASNVQKLEEEPRQITQAKVVTRTSRNEGGNTRDTWVSERAWNGKETLDVINLFLQGKNVGQIATNMSIDSKDVACKLTRISFNETQDLEELEHATRDGSRWSDTDHKKLMEMHNAGISLSGMAKILGRTKLAIGWRLADYRALRNLQK